MGPTFDLLIEYGGGWVRALYRCISGRYMTKRYMKKAGTLKLTILRLEFDRLEDWKWP